mmetsp:Transcript_21270/g.82547  ORF Transcript_21270/g.82547 Transcript_21270/m.82547 type:complete len:304 (+) Transcript_21270:1844-2755(+)
MRCSSFSRWMCWICSSCCCSRSCCCCVACVDISSALGIGATLTALALAAGAPTAAAAGPLAVTAAAEVVGAAAAAGAGAAASFAAAGAAGAAAGAGSVAGAFLAVAAEPDVAPRAFSGTSGTRKPSSSSPLFFGTGEGFTAQPAVPAGGVADASAASAGAAALAACDCVAWAAWAANLALTRACACARMSVGFSTFACACVSSRARSCDANTASSDACAACGLLPAGWGARTPVDGGTALSSVLLSLPGVEKPSGSEESMELAPLRQKKRWCTSAAERRLLGPPKPLTASRTSLSTPQLSQST